MEQNMQFSTLFFSLLFFSACTPSFGTESHFKDLLNGESITFAAQVTTIGKNANKYSSSTIIEVMLPSGQAYNLSFFDGQIIPGMDAILNSKEITTCLQENYGCTCLCEHGDRRIEACMCPGFRVYNSYSLFQEIPPFEEKKCYEITLEKKKRNSCMVVTSGFEETNFREIFFNAGSLRMQTPEGEYSHVAFSSITTKNITCRS
jgi:hypothetical protein